MGARAADVGVALPDACELGGVDCLGCVCVGALA